MSYKLITVCAIAILLIACTKNKQETPDQYHSAICAEIKERLSKKHPPQIQTRMLSTERAKLMKEFKEYHCEG